MLAVGAAISATAMYSALLNEIYVSLVRLNYLE